MISTADRLASALASSYRIESELGQGGMATVFLAWDQRHERRVALKVLRPEIAAALGLERFIAEVKLTARLNHPNILPLLDSGESEGFLYYTMPLMEGESLRDRLRREVRLSIPDALELAREAAEALDHAHRQGIVHRDVKPENILLHEGKALLADFGVALALTRAARERVTSPGLAVGTPRYMSPEQAIGGAEPDGRSDIYSLGCVLFEMIAGRPPFERVPLYRPEQVRLKDSTHKVPADLDRVVSRCLETLPDDRYPNARDLAHDLAACQAALTTRTVRLGVLVRRPVVLTTIVLSSLALVAAGGWFWRRESRAQWARTVAIPSAERLVQDGKNYAAFRLLRRAEAILPDDPLLHDLLMESSIAVTVTTTPAGARIYVRDFGEPLAARESVGVSPLRDLRVAAGPLVWEAALEGFHPAEQLLRVPRKAVHLTLVRGRDSVADMVMVPGMEEYELYKMPSVKLDNFWLDRYEVTNRQFKSFIERGGYQRDAHWAEALAADGRVSLAAIRNAFRDRTGMPGPATWALGTYPEGQADYPVGGISWYEAAAYCASVGKHLPTVYHWHRAADIHQGLHFAEFSNFSSAGPVAVGRPKSLGIFGTYDMAGNVKEWVHNQSDSHRRYILGGGWNEPAYQFREHDAQRPASREPTHGIRCAKYLSSLDPVLTGVVVAPSRDYRKQIPVGDAEFSMFRLLYRYDSIPLEARTDSVDEHPKGWRIEHVSFAAAYGNERVPALLYLPTGRSPPYQTVIYAPGAGAYIGPQRFDADGQRQWFLFLVRGGRAVLLPMYKGTFERHAGPLGAPHAWQEIVLYGFKDLGRSIDYLESRPDIDARRLGFFGISSGAGIGTIMTALESRIGASILLASGLPFFEAPPYADMLNFMPRIRVPTLMINGRNDAFFPLETAQEPMFRLLGTPAADKRHRVFESGHIPFQWPEVQREIVDWLDRYLGPVDGLPADQ
jgi:tRNA A-37 threonylcarbamoyl transferase component Bud32/cephalosporin-C deacetylase-like acetyl esterase